MSKVADERKCMPLSRNPQSYASFFWRLLEGMKAEKGEIRISDINAKRANKLRYESYGFIYALEAAAAKARREGNIELGGERLAEANTMRGYMIRVELHVDGQKIPTNKITPQDRQRLADLVYIQKDLTMQDEMEKLEAELDGIDLSPQVSVSTKDLDDFLPTIEPTVDLDSMFGPLKTPDDTNEEA